MLTGSDSYVLSERGWMVRIQPPKSKTASPRTLLLLHGWTGDETVMWIFTRNLPEDLWIFAPRGPVRAGDGYAWLQHRWKSWPALNDFAAVSEKLLEEFKHWCLSTGAPYETFDVMGFSQGAAMSFALAALYPDRVRRVLALAGFAPHDETMPGRYTALAGKKIYMAHGSRDDIVPVTLARETVEQMDAAGADVTYCESDVGHKLSADCLRGMEAFFEKEDGV